MLKGGDQKSIMAMFNSMQSEVGRIVDSIIELVYFMRGSISYDEMLMKTHAERSRIAHFLKDRMETESKNPYPNY